MDGIYGWVYTTRAPPADAIRTRLTTSVRRVAGSGRGLTVAVPRRFHTGKRASQSSGNRVREWMFTASGMDTRVVTATGSSSSVN